MVLPASVLREGISNMVGESGAWISENRTLNRVVATLPANKIWHFRIQDTRLPCSLPVVLYYISVLVASVCIYNTRCYLVWLRATPALAGRAAARSGYPLVNPC